jgi:hypothetical protein
MYRCCSCSASIWGEWVELFYMKHMSQRKYSYLDQGITERGKHCFTVTDATDSKFIKSISLTELQEKFLDPKE